MGLRLPPANAAPEMLDYAPLSGSTSARSFRFPRLCSPVHGICHQPGRIARPAFAAHDGYLKARDFGCYIDDFLHRITLAVTEIEAITIAALHQLLQNQQMRSAQIFHMDVIADAGAVRRVVIRSEKSDGIAPLCRGLQHQRNQMRLRLVAL